MSPVPKARVPEDATSQPKLIEMESSAMILKLHTKKILRVYLPVQEAKVWISGKKKESRFLAPLGIKPAQRRFSCFTLSCGDRFRLIKRIGQIDKDLLIKSIKLGIPFE